MKNPTNKYDGFAYIADNEIVPFHYENGVVDFLGGNISYTLPEGSNSIIGQRREKLTGGNIFFHFPLSLDSINAITLVDGDNMQQFSFGNVKQEVDFYIDQYQENSTYNQMEFEFSELDYFIPSSKALDVCVADYFMVKKVPEIINEFEFTYMERNVKFSLQISSTLTVKDILPYRTVKTESKLLLDFNETDDLEFLLALYHLVHNFFAFLCNRQNISLSNVKLQGKYLCKRMIKNGAKRESGDKLVPTTQTLFVVDKYKEEYEDISKIAKTIGYCFVAPAFEKLFSLFIDDKVSVLSIHSSIMTRNLYDLKQCLHITASFEHYHRTRVPKIAPSEIATDFKNDMTELLQKYIAEQTGPKKDKAKSLMKSIPSEPSLGDKIRKVFDGYDGWGGLKEILSETFGDDISELARIANDWRNELAHEKKKYEPTRQVIDAIRLVEHLNYCILLRTVGYDDEQTKNIVDAILAK